MAEYQSRFTGAEIDAAIANARSGLELQDAILDGSATEIYTEAEVLMNYALYQRTALSAFAGPSVSTIGSYALNGCTSLASLDLPVCTSIGAQSLRSCTSLASLDLPVCTSIGAASLYGCSSLTTLILRSPTVAALSNISALDNTPIASGTGYIYVPAALVESYKTATNWVTYASQIRAIEDYPEVHHD